MFHAKVPAIGSCVIIVSFAQDAIRLCTKQINANQIIKVTNTGQIVTSATVNLATKTNLNCKNGICFVLRKIAITRFAASVNYHLIILMASRRL